MYCPPPSRLCWFVTHASVAQNGLSAAVHSARIYGAQDARGPRRARPARVRSRSKSPPHLATPFIHAHGPPQSGTALSRTDHPPRPHRLIGPLVYVHPLRADGRLCADRQPGPLRGLDGGAFPGRRPAHRPARAGGDVGHQPPRCPDHRQGEPFAAFSRSSLIEFIPPPRPLRTITKTAG
jgi:hypothetical protein